MRALAKNNQKIHFSQKNKLMRTKLNKVKRIKNKILQKKYKSYQVEDQFK